MGSRRDVWTTELVVLSVVQAAVGRAITAVQLGQVGDATLVERLIEAVSDGHENAIQQLLAMGFSQEVIAEVLHRHDLTLPATLNRLLPLPGL
ncbi:hypothetical protein GCM10017781_45560 [Deinococcus metalli]|uniref:UBA domain-containing protein n=1 Tax=Deinococcus metalli TaxID=1141878 RepID=A0ABQ3JXQ8_9DEIO|nr:hypothetical protein GCM10017781_45560 [Deinococcus metalli]